MKMCFLLPTSHIISRLRGREVAREAELRVVSFTCKNNYHQTTLHIYLHSCHELLYGAWDIHEFFQTRSKCIGLSGGWIHEPRRG